MSRPRPAPANGPKRKGREGKQRQGTAGVPWAFGTGGCPALRGRRIVVPKTEGVVDLRRDDCTGALLAAIGSLVSTRAETGRRWRPILNGREFRLGLIPAADGVDVWQDCRAVPGEKPGRVEQSGIGKGAPVAFLHGRGVGRDFHADTGRVSRAVDTSDATPSIAATAADGATAA